MSSLERIEFLNSKSKKQRESHSVPLDSQLHFQHVNAQFPIAIVHKHSILKSKTDGRQNAWIEPCHINCTKQVF